MEYVFKFISPKKVSSFIVGVIVFLGLQILSMTLLKEVYTFGWMADHLYCYTWIAVIVLIAFDRIALSYCATFGNLIGTIIGEVLGNYLRDQRMSQITSDMRVEEIDARSIHYGVLIWLITFVAFLLVGIVIDIILKKIAKQASA